MNHPNYPHQGGPGPSSYAAYQHYGAHSPAPRPPANYYPYPQQQPPPPHVNMNGHQPYHQPGPSRGSGRGGHYGGSYAARGGHHYQPQHQHQHQHYQQPPYPPPMPIHSPHPYSPKYNHTPPYSHSPTGYSSYPSPNAPVFTPSWQTQQALALSPLPKQLSMPVPQPVSYDGTPSAPSPLSLPGIATQDEQPPVEVSSSEDTTTTQPRFYDESSRTPPEVSPVSLPVTINVPQEGPQEEHTAVEQSSVEDTPAPASASTSPLAPTAPILSASTSQYAQMGSIQTEPAPLSSTDADVSSSATRSSHSTWAIWSRRPHDPTHAPSIIISPRARPPADVVSQAMDTRTPPASPPPQKKEFEIETEVEKENETEGEPAEMTTSQHESQLEESTKPTQVLSATPSSAATEITETPTMPASPASSRTSVSASQGIVEPEPEADSTTSPSKNTEVSAVVTDSISTTAPEAERSKAATPMPTPTSAPAPTAATVPAAEMSTTTTTSPEASTTISTPAEAVTPAPAPSAPASTPAAPPVKKSWASLLRPAGASSSPSTVSPGAPGAPVRNALPTSSVVGFSIPADAPPPSQSQPQPQQGPVLPSNRQELIALLTSGPVAPVPKPVVGFAAAAAAANAKTAVKEVKDTMSKIKPRGLINSGNMCFANAVLQVLVYCPPFHRLFVDLGRLLVPGGAGVVGAGGATANASGPLPNGGTPAGSSANGSANSASKPESTTPLVDATVQFLREFIEDRPPKAGSAYSSTTNGKGNKGKEKEKEAEVATPAEDEWDPTDAFLPTYVYDAMKAKKRFDTMRGGQQEDAEEFFGFYLDTLEEELLAILNAVNPPRAPPAAAKTQAVEEKEEAAPPEDDGWLEVGKRNRMVVTRTIKATESPVTRIFGGKFRSTLRAPGQKDSVVIEDWRSLRLDIQRDQIHTIQDALSYISHPQTVQLTQSARPVEGQQQVLIEALPPILVLHIKRFCYDTATRGVVKVAKQVRFGPELEIGADVMVPPVGAKKVAPAKYKLFGALYHHGLSASGGHYTLDILHPNRYPSTVHTKPREGWVRIDDDLVSDVRHEDVFDAYERDESRNAYLLFYRRI